MKTFSFAIVLILMMGIGTVTGIAGPVRNSGVSRPAPGTMERRAILDGLHHWVRMRLGHEVRFVVRHLKVKSGWAWIITEPQSPDGRQRYEPLSALLKKGKNCWAVVAAPPGSAPQPTIRREPAVKVTGSSSGLSPQLRSSFRWRSSGNDISLGKFGSVGRTILFGYIYPQDLHFAGMAEIAVTDGDS